MEENASNLDDNALNVLDESSRRICGVHVQRRVVRRRKTVVGQAVAATDSRYERGRERVKERLTFRQKRQEKTN